MSNWKDQLEEGFDLIADKIETVPLLFAARVGPWLTPLVPAYFIHKAMIDNLDTPAFWAWVAAIALEVVGIAALYSLLRSYQWNKEKRKSDPEAPIGWSITAVIVYYVTAFLLVLFVEFIPEAIKFAPAAFVVLGGTSAGILVLLGDQKRREKAVESTKAKPQTKRKKQANAGENSQNASSNAPPVRTPKEEWRDAAGEILRKNPQISGAELGRKIGASERTGQMIKKELLDEIDFSVIRNGH